MNIGILNFNLDVKSKNLNLIVFIINFTEPPKCKSLQALKEEMPKEIWTSSGFDENDTVEMGKTIEFSCPKGLSFSFDNDDFNPYDDRYGK